MRFATNIREAIDSFVPWAGSDGARRPDAYKCRDCGRDVVTEADACPNCASGDLRPLYL